MTAKKQVFPIYDWTDNDVWLFLLRNHVDIPEIYLFLWQSGSSKRQMRVSQFFSVDTARSLVKMNEYYPDLMERIIRREPNAYLAALYWDSEMFGRSSRKRKEAEEGQEQRDYRQELIHLFNHMDVFFDTPHKRHVAERYRNFFMAVSAIATSADCKHIYEGLISGDPKMRAFRALYQRVYGRYINDAKKGEHHGQYHTTYGNSVNMWIKGCAKASEIAKIEYGAPIPEEYQSEVLKDYLAEMAADKEVK